MAGDKAENEATIGSAIGGEVDAAVQLARAILERHYGTEYTAIPYAPDLDAMLRVVDAALIIGDPALRLVPERLPYQVHAVVTRLGVRQEYFAPVGYAMC